MKTKEFIKRVEELGFEVNVYDSYINVLANNFFISTIYMNKMYGISTYEPILADFKNKEKFFDLMVEYAKTPIDERKEEKKKRSFI